MSLEQQVHGLKFGIAVCAILSAIPWVMGQTIPRNVVVTEGIVATDRTVLVDGQRLPGAALALADFGKNFGRFMGWLCLGLVGWFGLFVLTVIELILSRRRLGVKFWRDLKVDTISLWAYGWPHKSSPMTRSQRVRMLLFLACLGAIGGCVLPFVAAAFR